MTPQQLATQRMSALANANAVRMERAAMKRRLARMDRGGGFAAVAAMFDSDVDSLVDGYGFGELLRAVPGIGVVKTTEIAKYAGIVSQDRKLRDLTPRQRRAVAKALREPTLIWVGSELQVAA